MDSLGEKEALQGKDVYYVRRYPFRDFCHSYDSKKSDFLEGATDGAQIVGDGEFSISDDLTEALKECYVTKKISLELLLQYQMGIYLRGCTHWMANGTVSYNITDQGNLAICAEVCMTELLSAYLYIKEEGMNPLEQLSVQELYDYTHSDARGTIARLQKYVTTLGVCKESDYPFTGKRNDSRLYPYGTLEKIKCEEFKQVENRSFYGVIEHLKLKGPLITNFSITEEFKDFYDPLFNGGTISLKQGVYKHPDTHVNSPSDITHGVLISGFEESTGSLLVKNSHGLKWGNQGLARMCFTCFPGTFTYPVGVCRYSVVQDF